MYSVGYYGLCWTTTGAAEEGNAYFMRFDWDGINPNSNYYRGNGHQLRCLQE
ncbi:MAG: hypothetical protein K2G93_04240 [Rikenella sp.]|nr:hypothetical protein [Rikenella sp.]